MVFCSPATALLRQHHEAPNVLRYHAQDSLKDSDGNTWQVILFPENIERQTRYYLRLVGFPGIKSFAHPQPLEIITSQGNILTAIDAYAESAPATNVGQYELTSLISNSKLSPGSLKLAVTMRGNQELSLKIPREVVTEWELLTKEIEGF